MPRCCPTTASARHAARAPAPSRTRPTAPSAMRAVRRGGDALDADGYCEVCGMRRRQPGSRVEVDLRVGGGGERPGRVHRRNEDAFHLERCRTRSSRSSATASPRRRPATPPRAPPPTARAPCSPRPCATATDRRPRDARTPPTPRTGRRPRAGDQSCRPRRCRRARWSAPPARGGRDHGRLDRRQPRVLDRRERRAASSPSTTRGPPSRSPRAARPRRGGTRPEGARDHPLARRPTRPAARRRSSSTLRREPGRLILCSDGLWNYAPVPRTSSRACSSALDPPSPAPVAVARALTDTALAAVATTTSPSRSSTCPPREEASSHDAASPPRSTRTSTSPSGPPRSTRSSPSRRSGGPARRRAGRRGRDHHRRHVRIDGHAARQDAAPPSRPPRPRSTASATACSSPSSPAPPRARSSIRTGVPLAVASSQTRSDARDAIEELRPSGGTAIGSVARRWPPSCSATAPGRSATRSCSPTARTRTRRREQLDAALERCEGRFQCDCRGVGTDWEVAELRRSPRRCSARSTSSPSPGPGRRLPRDDRARDGEGTPTWRCGCGRRRARR